MNTKQKRQVLEALSAGIITKEDLKNKELIELIISENQRFYVILGDSITCEGRQVSIEEYNRAKAICTKLGKWIEIEVFKGNSPPLANDESEVVL